MKRLLYLGLIGGLIGLSLSLALDYKIDTQGGSLTLIDEGKAALETWANLPDVNLSLTESAEASKIIAYGDETLFGPDTLSITVLERRNRSSDFSALMNPKRDDFVEALYKTALLHEAGMLIGLQANLNTTGVMRPLLKADMTPDLSEADKAALVNLRLYAEEDINRDGKVDFYDLIEFGKAYGSQELNGAADINKDGVVDDKDLERLKVAYIFSPPAETPPGQQQETDATALDEALDRLANPDETEGQAGASNDEGVLPPLSVEPNDNQDPSNVVPPDGAIGNDGQP
ncbi:MAG: dockerin type I domain-containing protein [Deinococcales bacterium]